MNAPDAGAYITDLQTLEQQSTTLFAVESGTLPGLKREVCSDSAPSDRAKLMKVMGFVLKDGDAFIGPAIVVDLAGLAQSRLASSISLRCGLAPLATARLMVIFLALFTITGSMYIYIYIHNMC